MTMKERYFFPTTEQLFATISILLLGDENHETCLRLIWEQIGHIEQECNCHNCVQERQNGPDYAKIAFKDNLPMWGEVFMDINNYSQK